MTLKPLKVYEVNKYIKKLISDDPILRYISIEGEVSNFKHHYSGHMYFTLKDNLSKIKCVMFKTYNKNLSINIEDGINVIITGYVSVYENDGSYQLYVTEIKGKGLGELYVEFEKLKNKLDKEGLFDISNKKKLPFLPKKIGVVTSSTGAAIRDIITVINRRMPKIEILIYPVLVQGKNAHIDICKGLSYFNKRDDIDLVITGRGGGSIEELWAFNEEDVARTIFEMNKPVISAVGHETDFTIADFVSDLRAPTPSAAGEMAVPEIRNLNYTISTLYSNLQNVYNNYIKNKKDSLYKIKYENKLFSLPLENINEGYQNIDVLFKSLIEHINKTNFKLESKLSNLGAKLDGVSPLKTLQRGYSFINNENGDVVKSIDNIKENELLDIYLIDGKLKVKVTDKYIGGNYG